MTKVCAALGFLLCVCKAQPEPLRPPIAMPIALVEPALPKTDAIDRNHNKFSDTLEPRLHTPGTVNGGEVQYVFKAVMHGFIGSIRADRVVALSAALGDRLHLLAEPYRHEKLGIVETSEARARQVWPVTQGTPQTTIAVFDTGIDATHTDFANRITFWKDYSTDAHPTPVDFVGHGTHVSGLALGSGAAFDAAGALNGPAQARKPPPAACHKVLLRRLCLLRYSPTSSSTPA